MQVLWTSSSYKSVPQIAKKKEATKQILFPTKKLDSHHLSNVKVSIFNDACFVHSMHEIDFNVYKEIVVTVNHPSNIESSYLLKGNNMVMELSPIISKSVHCSDKLPTKFIINLNNIPELIDHWIISLAKQIKFWIPRPSKRDLMIEAAYLEEQYLPTQPKIEKQYAVNQLKSKKRRKSLPHRFKMDDRNSIILAPPDQRTDLQKLKTKN